MLSTADILAISDDPRVLALAASRIRGATNTDAALHAVVDDATRNHCLLRVLRRLEDNGMEFAQIQVKTSTVRQARLTSIMPGLERSGPTVSVAELRNALTDHRSLLLRVATDLGRIHPDSFVVAYGLGLTLGYPNMNERQSSDLDLFLVDGQGSRQLRRYLVGELGFVPAGTSNGTGAGRDLIGTKLVAEIEGHIVMVDEFVRGRPSAGHQWIPPFRIATLFATARRVEVRGGGTAYVPSPEHMLVMLAEKVQRKGDFSPRSVGDALTVLRAESQLDWSQVVDECHRSHVELGMGWVLSTLKLADPALIPDNAQGDLGLPRLDRMLQEVMTGAAVASRRHRLRARAIHRRLWTSRYVRSHPRPLAALIEVLGGRLDRPSLELAST